MKLSCRLKGNSRDQSVSVAKKWFLICSFATLCLPILEAILVSAEPPNVSCTPLLAANGIYHPWQSSYHVNSRHSQELKYADCCPQKMLYEVGAVRLTDLKARRTIKQPLLGIIRALALLLCYGMSFVYCTLFMNILCTTLSSEFVRGTKIVCLSEFQSLNEVKKELAVTALFLLIVLQYYWIDCALQRTHTCTRSCKYCITVYDHHVSKAIRICPLSVLSLRLLLSGDVETNPGPTRSRSHTRTNSLDTSVQFTRLDISKYIQYLVEAECSKEHINRQKKTIKAVKPQKVWSKWSRTLLSLNIDQLPLSVDDKQNLVYRIGEIRDSVTRYLQQGRVVLILTHPRNKKIPSYDKIQKGTKIAIANFESILPALSTNLKQLLEMLPRTLPNFEMIETSVENQQIESIKLEQTVRDQIMRLREANDKLLSMNMTLRSPLPPFDDATDLKIRGDDDFYNLIRKYMDMHSHELHAPIIKPSYRKDLLKILDEKYTLQPDTRINLGSMEYRHLLLILNQLYIHTTLGHSRDSKKKIPCAFCCSKRPINSHVWPEALLDAFKGMHSDDISNEFHLTKDNDANPNFQSIGKKNIAIHMLCEDCDPGIDFWTSGKENMLSRLYPFFSAYPYNPLKFDNSNNWLQRVLAVIMARGILMNCNLLRERKTSSFAKFLDLIRFAISPTSGLVPEVFVFPLPHSLYSNLEKFAAFERQLRYPTFPSICDLQKIGEKGRFYYMQFDCMHVVYPIDDYSDLYFKAFQIPQKIDSGCIPPTIMREKEFPPALLAINFVKSLDTVKAMMELKCPPKYQYESMLAVLQREIQFPTKANLPRYISTINSTDEQLEEISYEEQYAKLKPTGDSGEQMKTFKEKCIKRARRGSILQFIANRCRVQPDELNWRMQMDEEKGKVMEKFDKLVKRIDDAKQKLNLAETNECENLSESISSCDTILETYLNTKFIRSEDRVVSQATDEDDQDRRVEPESSPNPY